LNVQRKLEANGVERRATREGAKQGYLLAGVLFDANGEPMTPTHAVKKGVRYCYYVSRRLITDIKVGADRDQGQRLPAIQLERLLVERLRAFFADSEAVADALPRRRRDAPSVKRALGAAAEIVRTMAAGGEEQSFDFLRPFIARARVHLDRIEVDLLADRVVDALLAGCSVTNVSPESEGDPEAGDGGARLIRITISAQLKRAGKEMKFVIDGAEEGAPPDAPLVRLLTRAHSLARRLAASTASNVEEVGAQDGMGAPYAARLIRLNFLAPDIVIAILDGRQPIGLTARKLMADTRLPLEWSEQRKALGFA